MYILLQKRSEAMSSSSNYLLQEIFASSKGDTTFTANIFNGSFVTFLYTEILK